MNEYYENVYKKRLNRYGLNFQARVQGQRERDFENYLLKSIYRIDFIFDDERHPGSLEHYQQDNTETVCYLLTRRDLIIPNGTILEITNQLGNNDVWMVWWLEQITSSGYNRYVVLKMTHLLTWEEEGGTHKQYGYFVGSGQSPVRDALKSKSNTPIYLENNNLHLFITPWNDKLIKGFYFEISYKNIVQGFQVTGFDINTTKGIGYISVDPVPLKDLSENPEITFQDKKEDIYWINGG